MIGARSHDEFDHVYTDDPAVDLESTELDTKKYFQTFDRKYLPVRAGSTPTTFRIRPLSRRRFIAISGMSAHDRPTATVSYGVTNVQNFRLPSGDMFIPEYTGMGQDLHMTGPSLDAIFDAQLFTELMTVVMVASGLDPFADRHSGSSPG